MGEGPHCHQPLIQTVSKYKGDLVVAYKFFTSDNETMMSVYDIKPKSKINK